MPLEGAGNAGAAEVAQSVSAPADPVVEAIPAEVAVAGNAEVVQSTSAPADPVAESLPAAGATSDAPAGTPVAP